MPLTFLYIIMSITAVFLSLESSSTFGMITVEVVVVVVLLADKESDPMFLALEEQEGKPKGRE
jgi:hypothetical protein